LLFALKKKAILRLFKENPKTRSRIAPTHISFSDLLVKNIPLLPLVPEDKPTLIPLIVGVKSLTC